jgi:hypothetical protein
MKVYGGVEVQLHTLLTWALEEVSGPVDGPAALPPEEEPPIPTG